MYKLASNIKNNSKTINIREYMNTKLQHMFWIFMICQRLNPVTNQFPHLKIGPNQRTYRDGIIVEFT